MKIQKVDIDGCVIPDVYVGNYALVTFGKLLKLYEKYYIHMNITKI